MPCMRVVLHTSVVCVCVENRGIQRWQMLAAAVLCTNSSLVTPMATGGGLQTAPHPLANSAGLVH